jgi:hypothetical protein
MLILTKVSEEYTKVQKLFMNQFLCENVVYSDNWSTATVFDIFEKIELCLDLIPEDLKDSDKNKEKVVKKKNILLLGAGEVGTYSPY